MLAEFGCETTNLDRRLLARNEAKGKTRRYALCTFSSRWRALGWLFLSLPTLISSVIDPRQRRNIVPLMDRAAGVISSANPLHYMDEAKGAFSGAHGFTCDR